MATITDFIQHTTILLQSQSTASDNFSGLLICDGERILETLKTLPFTGKWTFVSLIAFNDSEFSQRYDLAVLIFTKTLADTTHHAIYNIAVQRCRDLFAEHTLIFAPPEQDFIAFGFSKVGEDHITLDHITLDNITLDEAHSLIGWQFNLFDYKQLPDWFNSRFWANPENWNKFRW